MDREINLQEPKLEKKKLTRTRFSPDIGTGSIAHDVDNIKRVTFISHVFNGPFQSTVAALGEVSCHPNFSILYHGASFFLL